MMPTNKTQAFTDIDDQTLNDLAAKLFETQQQKKVLDKTEKDLKEQIFNITKEKFATDEFEKTGLGTTAGLNITISTTKGRVTKNWEELVVNNRSLWEKAEQILRLKHRIELDTIFPYETTPEQVVGKSYQTLTVRPIKK